MADNIQDVSGLPIDDTMAQLELQRRLKLAQQLQESQMPEGQMVSGRFVAPSWTQYAANLFNKYQGGQKEAEAMKQYGEYQKEKQSKLSQAFDEYIKGKGPIAETTTQDNYVSKPYALGANIPTSMFGTTEQLTQTSPSFNTQNMPSQMVNQPITSTTYRQPTRTEQLANITNFLKKSGNTDMLNKVVLSEAENLFKTPESMIGKVDPDKFTSESLAKFAETHNWNDLRQIDKIDHTASSNIGKLTSELDAIIAKNPNDPRIKIYQNAIQKETTYKDESNKPPAGYAWGKPDANGMPTLIPYKGGPADKSTILKPVPPANTTAFIENNNAIDKINNAIDVINNTPDSSFGLKNIAGDTVMQRIDPKGVNARSAIAGIAGQKYHDISGAAVSASEAERLKPYIPSAQDTKANVLKKLENMKREYANTNNLIQGQFNESQGYKPLSTSSTQGGWSIQKVE